ncbi:hypothetical protein ACOMHN_044217 [Nucella lapillus]
MFRCSDEEGTVQYTLVCDFQQNCFDNSDESFCEHPLHTGFLCSNGQYVLHGQRCNEFSDCLDDSDEKGCHEELCAHCVEFNDGKRLPPLNINLDGSGYFTHHVMTRSEPCPDSHYLCSSVPVNCLPFYTRCNGFSDCTDGEDEQNCRGVTCPGLYQCQASTVCLHGDHLCDGWGQCPQQDDELMCDMMTCPEGCLCEGDVYRAFFWLISACATVGNVICFIATLASKNVLGQKCLIFVAHLQLSNLCMGGHVSVVLVADSMFEGHYLQHEQTWTNSVTCKMSGFLSLLSSEVSVLTLWFIVLDHVIVFCFPDSLRFYTSLSTTAVCTVIWFVGALLSLIPFLPGLSHWGLSGQSGLCRMALSDHFLCKQEISWFTVTVVVNFLLSLIIMSGQCVIYRRLPKYRILLEHTKRSYYSSAHLIRKVAVTDAVCWFSFGLVTLMASQGVTLFKEMHGTLVVFMLPFNSALNPLLTLWSIVTERRLQAAEQRLIHRLRSRLAQHTAQPSGRKTGTQ